MNIAIISFVCTVVGGIIGILGTSLFEVDYTTGLPIEKVEKEIK